MLTQEMIDRVYRAAYISANLLDGEAQAKEHVKETLALILAFRHDGCDRAKAEEVMIGGLDDIDLEALGETFAATKRRLISCCLDEVFPVTPSDDARIR
jgi:hypothetical protein